QHFRGVHPAVCSEPHESLPCGCPGQAGFPRGLDDHLAQGTSAMPIGFADEDPEEDSFANQCHERAPAAIACTSVAAAQKASRPITPWPTMLPSAAVNSPPRMSEAVSNVKDEKVV